MDSECAVHAPRADLRGATGPCDARGRTPWRLTSSLPLGTRGDCGEWMSRTENLVMLGQSGVGKSRLLEGIGRRLCALGKRVRYTTMGDLIRQLTASLADGMLPKQLSYWTNFELLSGQSRQRLPSRLRDTSRSSPSWLGTRWRAAHAIPRDRLSCRPPPDLPPSSAEPPVI
jgi:hypothetical protein